MQKSTGTMAVPSVKRVVIRLIPYASRWYFPLQCRLTTFIRWFVESIVVDDQDSLL
ncbi:MAG TPA: hypothetical protein PK679_04555 [Methanolinea sp.]|nr:hypothetical protein [Methanolinea sp.]